MKIRFSALVAALWLSAMAVASAQETTGTLTGKLSDGQGLALPGVTVTVTGPQGAKSFITDAEGQFRAPFLVPGSYDVRAELEGFKSVVQRAVPVSLGQTSSINLQLEVGGISETVSVTATASIVDTTSTTTGAVITADLLARIPVGRRFSDTLYLAPGVSTTSTGTANPSMAGSSGLDNLYVVDGVNVTNTGYGALGSYSIIFGSLGNATPFDFIQEVQVKTGGYEAEFGQALGGVVNVVTKSGSNTLRGSFFGYTQPKALEGTWKTIQTRNGTVNTVGIEESDGGAEAGFPIFKDRLFFFGAINPGVRKTTFVAPDGFPLTSLGEVTRKRSSLSYSAKSTLQLSAGHRIDASFFGDPSNGAEGPQRASSLLRRTTSAFSTLDQFGGHNQTLRYDGAMSANWLIEASIARAVNKIVETPSEDTWAVTDTRVTPNIVTGGIGTYEKGNNSKNLQYSAKTTVILGDHNIKVGGLFEDVEYTQLNNRTGPTFVAHDGRRTATGASISILPDPTYGAIYRVTRANFNTGRTTTQEYWAGFAQDQWRVNDRLTLNLGLRYEQQTLVGGFKELTTLDGDTLPNFALKNNWAPRIGFVYDVVGNGKSKVYGNWGRFYARIPNDLAARALSADDGMSRGDYFDAALTRPVPNGTLAANVTSHFLIAGVGADLIDPDAKLSYKDEFVGGVEYQVFGNSSVGLRYIHRGIGRVLEDISPYPTVACDFGVDAACVTDYILTNPSSKTAVELGPGLSGVTFEDPEHTYDAVEALFEKRFSNNWMLNANYRWSRLHGTYEGFFREDNGQSDPGITSLYDFPTGDPTYTAIGGALFGYEGDIRNLGAQGAGPLPLDRPHMFKVQGNYAFDNGLAFGGALQAFSGKPLTALASLPPYNNSGEIPLTARGEGFETVDGFRERTPFEYQVDLQASYAVNIGSRKLTLLADAFNVLNLTRTLDYDADYELSFGVLNPDFGTPSNQNYQRPFRLRIGARFAW